MSVLQMLLGSDNDVAFGLKPPVQTNGRAGQSIAVSDDAATIPLTIVVGAAGYLDGAVFVYHYNGTAFGFHSTISSPAPNIDFGFAVALSSDGSQLAIGAPDDQGEGRVHMYLWDGAKYAPDQILDSNESGLGGGSGSRFGESLSFNKVADAILAGAPLGQSNDRGYAYTWFKSGTWLFVQGRIGELDSKANGNFSDTLGMSANGLIAVFSQPGNNTTRIFERATISASFIEATFVNAQNAFPLLAVTIVDDGSLVFQTNSVGVGAVVNQGGSVWAPGITDPIPGGGSVGTWGKVVVSRNNQMFVGNFGGSTVHEFSYANDGLTITFVQGILSPNGVQAPGAAGFGFSLALVFPTNLQILAAGEPGRTRLGLANAGNAYALVT